MRIYKGYPCEVKIDGIETTVYDVERLIVSLMYDERLIEGDKDFLEKTYKLERQRYLDGLFEMTGDNRKRLQALEQKVTDEIDRCDARILRLKKREEEKAREGMRAASSIQLYMDVDNIDDYEQYSDEEIDLWCHLFSGGDTFFCGLHSCSVVVGEEERNRTHLSPSENPHRQAEEFATLNFLRKHYGVAWQDLQKIKDFRVMVRFMY